MTDTTDDVDVAIIGGGPAGLTAATMLGRLGIDVALFERRPGTSHLPRAHLLNQRTMEILHNLGIAEDVYDMSPPEDRWHRVAWYTSLSGSRPGQGREIGHLPAWGGGPDAQRYAAASPMRYANVPQMRLDPLLRRHADNHCPGRIQYGREVTGLRQDGDGVCVQIDCHTDGSSRTVRAKYVIGADGGRACADLIGVAMEGPTRLLDMVSMHITADLSPWTTDDEVLLYYFVDPKGRGSFRASLCAMGPDSWGTHSKQWAFHQAFAWGDPAARNQALLLDRLRDVLGIPELEVEVHAVSHWEFEGVTAQRYREGNVFLVGNAAHRHPPTGGLGLNTAIQDVDNLTWKIALVLRGAADDTLLDTYDSERRPVGKFNVEHSLRNAGGHGRVAAALGFGPEVAEADCWVAVDEWLADGPAGDAPRARVAEAVASNADDYGQLNVEVGFAYHTGALVSDGDQPPGALRSLREYTPSTRPGRHLPHVWVSRHGATVSTLDLIDQARFTLLVDPSHEAEWNSAAMKSGVDIVVVPVNAAASPAAWRDVRQIDDGGALLVRPDRHIAWRTESLPTDPAARLATVVQSLLTPERVLR